MPATTESAPEAAVSGLERAIRAFVRHARDELGLSPASLDAYGRDLRQFQHWCKSREISDPAAVCQADVRAFAASRHRQGINPKSIQRQLSALRRFFRYLRREGLVREDPVAGVRAPRIRRRLPRPLDIDQVMALLAIPEESELATRDRAMLELFYSSGLRVSELAHLTWARLETSEGLVRVLGKGRRERLVPVGRQALEALARWRRIRASLPEPDQARIFTSIHGRPLGVRAIQKRVAYWSERQGLDQRVHPHQLRHSFASHILESSGDLRAVQELLGHANLSTTQIYTHLDFQHLVRVYDDAHPRAKKKSSAD